MLPFTHLPICYSLITTKFDVIQFELTASLNKPQINKYKKAGNP
jgi:hypothetical protein